MHFILFHLYTNYSPPYPTGSVWYSFLYYSFCIRQSILLYSTLYSILQIHFYPFLYYTIESELSILYYTMYIRFSPSYLTASVLSISILYNVYQQSQNYPFYILYNLYKILSINLKLYAAVGNSSPIKIGLTFFFVFLLIWKS